MAVIGQFELLGRICKIFEYFKITGHFNITLIETTLGTTIAHMIIWWEEERRDDQWVYEPKYHFEQLLRSDFCNEIVVEIMV